MLEGEGGEGVEMVTLTISLDNSYCKAYRLPEELFWSRLIESKASFKWLKKLAEATTAPRP